MDTEATLKLRFKTLFDDLLIACRRHPDETNGLLPCQIKWRKGHATPVGIFAPDVPQGGSNHVLIARRAGYDRITSCVEAIMAEIFEHAPCLDSFHIEPTIEVGKGAEGLTLRFNKIREHIGLLPPEDLAEQIAATCAWLRKMPQAHRVYDVSGRKVPAQNPTEALTIYGILMHPANPLQMISRGPHVVLERHEGIMPDIEFFHP